MQTIEEVEERLAEIQAEKPFKPATEPDTGR